MGRRALYLLQYESFNHISSSHAAICIGAAWQTRPGATPARLDTTTRRSPVPTTESKPPMSSKVLQQCSSGSLAGLCTGALVALFSRTLVFLGSTLALVVYIASRYGVNLTQTFGIKKLASQPAWMQRIQESPYFAGSFIVTFTLAAFVRL